MLVMQHFQLLIGIHDPRDWPGPMWKRMQRQKATMSKQNHRERAGQNLSSTHVEEGESTHNLVHPREV
jgi:hypothetical protein